MPRLRTAAGTLALLILFAICGLLQFLTDHLLPLIVAISIAAAVARIWPRRRWCVAGAPVIITALLLTDAFLFHHRLAVALRTSAVFFDSKIIEGILPPRAAAAPPTLLAIIG